MDSSKRRQAVPIFWLYIINGGRQRSLIGKTFLEELFYEIRDRIGSADYEISEIQRKGGEVRISARYAGPKLCPDCGKDQLRNKGTYQRRVRHEDWGLRHWVLELRACKWQCKSCGRYFRERFPGILPCQRSSEAFQKMIYRDHLDGINRSRLGRRQSW